MNTIKRILVYIAINLFVAVLLVGCVGNTSTTNEIQTESAELDTKNVDDKT